MPIVLTTEEENAMKENAKPAFEACAAKYKEYTLAQFKKALSDLDADKEKIRAAENVYKKAKLEEENWDNCTKPDSDEAKVEIRQEYIKLYGKWKSMSVPRAFLQKKISSLEKKAANEAAEKKAAEEVAAAEAAAAAKKAAAAAATAAAAVPTTTERLRKVPMESFGEILKTQIFNPIVASFLGKKLTLFNIFPGTSVTVSGAAVDSIIRGTAYEKKINFASIMKLPVPDVFFGMTTDGTACVDVMYSARQVAGLLEGSDQEKFMADVVKAESIVRVNSICAVSKAVGAKPAAAAAPAPAPVAAPAAPVVSESKKKIEETVARIRAEKAQAEEAKAKAKAEAKAKAAEKAKAEAEAKAKADAEAKAKAKSKAEKAASAETINVTSDAEDEAEGAKKKKRKPAASEVVSDAEEGPSRKKVKPSPEKPAQTKTPNGVTSAPKPMPTPSKPESAAAAAAAPAAAASAPAAPAPVVGADGLTDEEFKRKLEEEEAAKLKKAKEEADATMADFDKEAKATYSEMWKNLGLTDD